MDGWCTEKIDEDGKILDDGDCWGGLAAIWCTEFDRLRKKGQVTGLRRGREAVIEDEGRATKLGFW